MALKRLLRYLRNTRIQTKLLFAFTLLILLQSIFQSIMYYQMVSKQIISNTLQSMNDAIDKDNSLVDTIFFAVTTSMRSYERDPDLRRLQESIGAEDFQMVASSLENTLYNRYFWDQEKEVLSVHLVSPHQQSYFYRTSMTFAQFERDFPDYHTLDGTFLWTPTRRLYRPGLGTRDAFSAVYKITPKAAYWGLHAAQPVDLVEPYLVVNLDPASIFQYYESSLPTLGSNYLIVTDQEEYVASSYDSIGWEWTTGEGRECYQDARRNGSGSGVYQIGGENLLVSYATSEINGWTSFLIVPESELTGSILSSAFKLLALNNLASLVVLVAILSVSVYLMRPVHELAGFAKQISTGDFDAEANLHVGGDVGAISDAIHQLNTWLKTLMQKNREISRREQDATIAALEMQLNPHFLFNTLNSINLLALKNGQKEISSTIVNLAGMMHYTLDQQNRFVQLSDELEFLEKYVFLMRARSSSPFSMEYHIPEETMHCVIPKMVLQICVENAIIHGIQGQAIEGIITVRAVIRENRLVLQVEDNGQGISPEQERQLRGSRKGHIGVANINKRLKLLFGGEYGVSVVSASHPTIVELSVPVIQNVPLPPLPPTFPLPKDRTS